MSLLSGLAVAALLATLLMTRAPLEENVALTQPVSAHSFSYNRLGLALGLVALPGVLLPRAPGRILEPLSGVAVGGAMAMALLCKWSFAVIPPLVLLAFLLQARWQAFGGGLAGLLMVWFALDPFGAQFLGSLDYMRTAGSAEERIGGAAAIGGLVFKTLNILLSHLPVMLALLAGVILAMRRQGLAERLTWLASMGLMIVAFGANCVVMGPYGLIGHQVVPVAAVLLILCFEKARLAAAETTSALRILALVVTGAFLLPHLANTAVITATGFAKQDEVLVTEGPMAGYLQRHEGSNPTADRKAVLAAVARELVERRSITRDMEYPVFVDGLIALGRLGVSDRGVIADGPFNYEFALGGPPITGYPLWARVSSPEVASMGHIPAQADIVMILRHDSGHMGKLLKARMGTEFATCLQTGLWDIFARATAGIAGCDGS